LIGHPFFVHRLLVVDPLLAHYWLIALGLVDFGLWLTIGFAGSSSASVWLIAGSLA
jgi:hypothetical protein